ncbi:IclR family transcriptional regulator [Brevibacterium sp. ACRRH]|uniref:IclR family transcriptional regulator n=1 Tax=Brevibacterium sp. ACRRH TaxID=2918183 RepID=UPI001EF70CF5|nr:IclR family transcriptional regulator [Brevibacterium sp. ACRRH]MCG7297951.1 IclR family transcriptional regulator [Brevibacterium sp. ACRRH]
MAKAPKLENGSTVRNLNSQNTALPTQPRESVLERAKTVIDAVAVALQQGQSEASFNYIVTRTQLPKSTVHRILLNLIDVGYIERCSGGGYTLGPGIMQLATLSHLRSSFTASAHDALNRLATISGETGFLTIRRGTIAECVMRVEGTGPIRNTVLHAGDRHPLGIGAGSLAILASLPTDEANAVRRTNVEVFGAQSTIGELERNGQLAKAIKQSRTDGFSINPGMLLPESWAIGVAVTNDSGRAHFALSLATIEQRLSRARQVELNKLLRAEAVRLKPHIQHF